MAKKEKTEVREVTSVMGTPVKIYYTPDDLKGSDYEKDLGHPGEYPFARGIYPTMYRESFWTMRQYSGQATSESTNERFKFLSRKRREIWRSIGLTLKFGNAKLND
jgi:methylmalonyl-CoA mutase N-terminal domain/subunit